jgi:hypothetical protein
MNAWGMELLLQMETVPRDSLLVSITVIHLLP